MIVLVVGIGYLSQIVPIKVIIRSNNCYPLVLRGVKVELASVSIFGCTHPEVVIHGESSELT